MSEPNTSGNDQRDSTETLGKASHPTVASPRPGTFSDTLNPISAGPDIGAMVGNYRIERKIGEGGFGSVYEAVDIELKRPVAIKFIHSGPDPVFVDLFKREAQIVANLDHEHIVRVYAFGQYASLCYFAMEFVPLTADKLLREYDEGLPPLDALRIVAEACDALYYAHRRGILHRDIKPENLLLAGAKRTVKVADFGLATIVETGNKSLLDGRICGSPRYMSPEQARGDGVDKRSDIFSLGVTLYRLLSNQFPFEGGSTTECQEQIVADKRIPLRDRRADLPDPIYAIVDRATASKPADRYANAREMATAIRDIIADVERTGRGEKHSTVVLRSGQRAKRVRYAGIAAAALLIAAAIVYAVFTPDGRENSLAIARSLINGGNASAAETQYRLAVQSEPDSDEAKMGLIFSLLQQGRFADAQPYIAEVQDAVRRAEAEAAIAYAERGVSARPELEASETQNGAAYVSVLVALADIAEGRFESAVSRLSSKAQQDFLFEWQYGECLLTLGQAYARLGDHAKAAEVFARANAVQARRIADIAQEYVEIARSEADASRRASLREDAQRLKKMIDENPELAAPPDAWTSRPLVLMILPPAIGASGDPAIASFHDVLPVKLARDLQRTAGFATVERDKMEMILSEQELSANLSSNTSRLRLGQLLGARIIADCRVDAESGKQVLAATLIDTETTSAHYTDDVEIPMPASASAASEAMAAVIAAALRDAYPLQARLTATPNGAVINIGSNVGLKPGTRFAVHLTPNTVALDGAFAIAGDAVGASQTPVTLEGLELRHISADGLFVKEVVETQKAAT